jgi:hypothetical protein
MRIAAAAAALLALVGCGGKDDINRVNGSYRGQSIDVSDGLLLSPQRDLFGGAVSVVVLESAASVCALMQTSPINNTRIVTIGLGIETPAGLLAEATVPGTYVIGGPAFVAAGTKLAAVRFGVIGACGGGATADAISGSVRIDAVEPNTAGAVAHLAGSFAAVFDNGERLSGAFDVALCRGARVSFHLCSR